MKSAKSIFGQWRAKNKDKVRETNRRYWKRRAAKKAQAEEKSIMKNTVKILLNPKTEAQHQANVISWSILHTCDWPELAGLHHIPNGGTRDAVEGKHLKDRGVKAGVPDLHLPVARRGYHSLYIEMKTKKGRTSDAQDWWREYLTAQGNFVEVCHGWESAVQVLEWYLSLPKGGEHGG